jgi:hypothetical protein
MRKIPKDREPLFIRNAKPAQARRSLWAILSQSPRLCRKAMLTRRFGTPENPNCNVFFSDIAEMTTCSGAEGKKLTSYNAS